MSSIRASSLPVPHETPPRDVEGAIERAISDVPAPRTHAVADPDREAERIAKARRQAGGAWCPARSRCRRDRSGC